MDSQDSHSWKEDASPWTHASMQTLDTLLAPFNSKKEPKPGIDQMRTSCDQQKGSV